MKRNPCYCGSIPEESLAEQGVPKGFCGLCEICTKPGHLQHFPGSVPYTGAWCDSCFLKVKRKHQAKVFGIFGLVFVAWYVLAN